MRLYLNFMSVQISYRKSVSKQKVNNVVLFVDEKFNILNFKKHISSSEYSFISDLLKTKNLKKKILTFDINSKKNNTGILEKKYYKF